MKDLLADRYVLYSLLMVAVGTLALIIIGW